MASLVEIRAGQDPSLADVIRSREGRDPVQIADDLLSRAQRAMPNASLGERRVLLAPKLMASALRTGDYQRFALVLEESLAQAQELRDRDLASQVTDDLHLLRAYWDGDVELEALRQREFLADVVPLLPKRKP